MTPEPRPRWFAEEFVHLYDRVKSTDPDIPEEYGKWAENARHWLSQQPEEIVAVNKPCSACNRQYLPPEAS